MRVVKIRKAAVLGSTERALWTFVRPAGVEYLVPRYEPHFRLFLQALTFLSKFLIRSAPSQRHQRSFWFFDSWLVLEALRRNQSVVLSSAICGPQPNVELQCHYTRSLHLNVISNCFEIQV
jgi:hypothetical protein